MQNASTTPGLMVIKGPLKNKMFSLDTNLITIGRGDDADICLTGDTSVSRVHVSLRLVQGRYVVANKSDNGTLVNGKLASERELQDGDRIQLGDVYLLEFSDGSKPAAIVKPSVFKKPAVLIGLGVYVAAMIGAGIYLSNAPDADPGVDSAHVANVLDNFGSYMNTGKLTAEERDARQRAVRAYLRAGFIAEREGNVPEARRVYLRVLDYTKDGRNPAYQYALERLRASAVPMEQR